MKYKVRVKKTLEYWMDVEVEVPFIGTDEESSFQMEERAEELAKEKADEYSSCDWEGGCTERDAYIIKEDEAG